MRDKYGYYWKMKERKESNKPLDWDKIIAYVVFYPMAIFLLVLYVLSGVAK